jgi:predicted nucleic acid-binding Zn ribbon protein
MEKGPELVGEILSRLFTARGWGRRQERLRLEQAWEEVMAEVSQPTGGEQAAEQTQVGGLRRGVLEVIVGNAVLLQELAHFRKRQLLEGLQRRLPRIAISELRFRAGVVKK